MNYWDECISIAFDESGITATKEQLEYVAGAVQVAHENYGMARGHDCIPNPLAAELKETKRKLEVERDKRVCPECTGRGSIETNGPCHSAVSMCDKCRGEGKV